MHNLITQVDHVTLDTSPLFLFCTKAGTGNKTKYMHMYMYMHVVVGSHMPGCKKVFIHVLLYAHIRMGHHSRNGFCHCSGTCTYQFRWITPETGCLVFSLL